MEGKTHFSPKSMLAKPKAEPRYKVEPRYKPMLFPVGLESGKQNFTKCAELDSPHNKARKDL